MPTIPLWLGLAAAMPLTWSPLKVYFIITLIVSLLGWTGLAREVRGRFFALRGEDFVTAARLDGSTERRVIFRHILPSLTSHILAVVTLAIPTMIVAETALSFLGVGLKPPVVSWGVLLQDAQNIRTDRDRALAADLAVARRRHGGARLQLPRRRPARRRRPVRVTDGHETERPADARPSAQQTAASRCSRVRDLSIDFHLRTHILHAVAQRQLRRSSRGRTLALVGESGSGKSVTARALLRIIDKPGRVAGGTITLDVDGQTTDIDAARRRTAARSARSAAGASA